MVHLLVPLDRFFCINHIIHNRFLVVVARDFCKKGNMNVTVSNHRTNLYKIPFALVVFSGICKYVGKLLSQAILWVKFIELVLVIVTIFFLVSS